MPNNYKMDKIFIFLLFRPLDDSTTFFWKGGEGGERGRPLGIFLGKGERRGKTQKNDSAVKIFRGSFFRKKLPKTGLDKAVTIAN